MDHIKFKEGMLRFVALIIQICFLEGFFTLIYVLSWSTICSRQSLLDHITVQLAPRAADELWYGEDQVRNMISFNHYTASESTSKI